MEKPRGSMKGWLHNSNLAELKKSSDPYGKANRINEGLATELKLGRIEKII
jgi:hypothetical protein